MQPHSHSGSANTGHLAQSALAQNAESEAVRDFRASHRAALEAATRRALEAMADETTNPDWGALATKLRDSLARELCARLALLCPAHDVTAAVCTKATLAEVVIVHIDRYGISIGFSDAFIASYQEKLDRFCDAAQPPIPSADRIRLRSLPSVDLCRNFGPSPEEALECFNNRVLSPQNRVKL